MTGTLLVVGAGPKALAVAAKAAVLRELDLPAPRVIVAETHVVGANWLAAGGWSDGNQRLGTSPEKDLGFPYRSGLLPGRNREIDQRMARYSWTAFLIDQGGYAEWIDRGRPNPQHHLWARYLQWAARRVDLETVTATVTRLRADAGRWHVELTDSDGARSTLAADAVMITGPGPNDGRLLDHPRVLSIAQFWELAGRRALPPSTRAAVVGGGETAGSALDELTGHDALTIAVVSPAATLYTRGESYFENALFSDPAGWPALTEAERREVIRRTDRGVISMRVQERLLADHRVRHLQGRVVAARAAGELVELTLGNATRPDQTHTFDLVVDATGGRPLWFLDLFDQATADLLELAVGWPVTVERVESAIGYDLAVAGFVPTLHLPNLAGPAQGPGFPNLSCLGALSDRILQPAATGPGRSHPAAAAAATR
jgi:mycobactin lysine-N-oxygenase